MKRWIVSAGLVVLVLAAPLANCGRVKGPGNGNGNAKSADNEQAEEPAGTVAAGELQGDSNDGDSESASASLQDAPPSRRGSQSGSRDVSPARNGGAAAPVEGRGGSPINGGRGRRGSRSGSRPASRPSSRDVSPTRDGGATAPVEGRGESPTNVARGGRMRRRSRSRSLSPKRKSRSSESRSRSPSAERKIAARAVTRAIVQEAVTDEIRQEFTVAISKLAAILDRGSRLTEYERLKATWSKQSLAVIELMLMKENFHITHVRSILSRIESFDTSQRKPHDYTKDEMYFFVMTSKFDFKVKGDDLESLFEKEADRHYKAEPHHPEHEKFHDTHSSNDDILEMSVDRMSRSIQESGNGKVDMKNMRQYMPKFPKGDNERKQALYMKYVSEYVELTEKVYAELQ